MINGVVVVVGIEGYAILVRVGELGALVLAFEFASHTRHTTLIINIVESHDLNLNIFAN